MVSDESRSTRLNPLSLCLGRIYPQRCFRTGVVISRTIIGVNALIRHPRLALRAELAQGLGHE